MNSPAVLTLVNPRMMAGCTAWRVAWPLSELHRRGYRVGYGRNDDPRIAGQIDQADVVVMARLAWDPGDEATALAWRDLLHRGNKTLVYETDDDLYSPSCVERIKLTWQPDEPRKPDDQLERERQARAFAITIADGVTTSTAALARVLAGFTDKPIKVVPNAIDLPRFRQAIDQFGDRDPDRPVTIGWAGGNRPDADAAAAAVAWGWIARRFPDVRFVVGGYPLQALIDAVPADRLVVVPKRSIHTYPATLAMIDILCCPLEQNTFNDSKSPIKAFEGAAAGCAVVASPTVYGDLLEHGKDGLVCETADDWGHALAWLVQDREYRRHLAQALLRKVERDHTLAGNVHRWPAAWADLVADFRIRRLRGDQPRGPTLVGGPR